MIIIKPSTLRFSANPVYVAYANHLRALDYLDSVKKSESPEAEEVREKMGGMWDALDEGEQLRVRGVSVDLYSLRKYPLKPAGAREAFSKTALLEAIEARNAEVVLRMLRLDMGDFFLHSPTIAYMQGVAYQQLGDDFIAKWFFEAVFKAGSFKTF